MRTELFIHKGQLGASLIFITCCFDGLLPKIANSKIPNSKKLKPKIPNSKKSQPNLSISQIPNVPICPKSEYPRLKQAYQFIFKSALTLKVPKILECCMITEQ